MKKIFTVALLVFFGIALFAQTNSIVDHKIVATINPATSEIFVIDTISFSGELLSEFMLNAELVPESLTKGLKLQKVKEVNQAEDVGMDRDDAAGTSSVNLIRWKIKGNGNSIVISYRGTIKSAIEQSEENYQRGFAESPGIISETGIYLAGSTWWVPIFDNSTMTFTLSTDMPDGWKNVTQGKRIAEKTNSGRHFDTWVCEHPQEEIFLIAAKFHEYSHKMNSGVDAMAFLRTPDEGLANKYLEVTEQYMEMYVSMLGEYPYSKFALVENFWETGYGMPSFTLLGEKIIRFPFILHSSYPHELLHNWWGNSVYVDFESGNWCEGITAYMADHLIKEGRNAGEEYRRETLQKFSNFVTPENDCAT